MTNQMLKAARFEERLGEESRTVYFIQAGIEKSPRYGLCVLITLQYWVFISKLRII